MQTFRRKARIQPGQRLIGMAARLATEKGVEYLVQAMPSVIERHPQARACCLWASTGTCWVSFTAKACPADRSPGRSLDILGNLTARELAVFFRECELTVLPGNRHRVLWHGPGGSDDLRHPGRRQRPARRAPAGADDRYGQDHTPADALPWRRRSSPSWNNPTATGATPPPWHSVSPRMPSPPSMKGYSGS